MDHSQPNKLLASTLQTAAIIMIIGRKIYSRFLDGKWPWANLDDQTLMRFRNVAFLMLIVSIVIQFYDRYLTAGNRVLLVIGAVIAASGLFLPSIAARTGLEISSTLIASIQGSALVIGGIMALVAYCNRKHLLKELGIVEDDDEDDDMDDE